MMKKNVFIYFFLIQLCCLTPEEKRLQLLLKNSQKLLKEKSDVNEAQARHVTTIEKQLTKAENEVEKWQLKYENQNRGKMDRYASIGLKFTTMVLAGALVWHFWIREILYPSKPIILPNPYRSAEKVSKTPDSTASRALG